MQKMGTYCMVAALAMLSVAADAGELKSGLQVGDSATPFQVKDCTGPNKGKSLCYR